MSSSVIWYLVAIKILLTIIIVIGCWCIYQLVSIKRDLEKGSEE